MKPSFTPSPQFVTPQLILSSYRWPGVPCETIPPGGSREQQAAPDLEAVPRGKLSPRSRAPRLGSESQTVQTQSFQNCPFLASPAYCLGKWLERGGNRKKKFNTSKSGGVGGRGEGVVCFNTTCFSGPEKLHPFQLCFTSTTNGVLNVDFTQIDVS